jgi:hypothetical protein
VCLVPSAAKRKQKCLTSNAFFDKYEINALREINEREYPLIAGKCRKGLNERRMRVWSRKPL